jgi:hypothetical protein
LLSEAGPRQKARPYLKNNIKQKKKEKEEEKGKGEGKEGCSTSYSHSDDELNVKQPAKLAHTVVNHRKKI